jgi:hypothetical protein
MVTYPITFAQELSLASIECLDERLVTGVLVCHLGDSGIIAPNFEFPEPSSSWREIVVTRRP